jgi:outer membrane protein assembly factor BamB
MSWRTTSLLLVALLGSACASSPSTAGGWHAWRGPHQNGTSDEVGLFDTLEVDGENHLWTHDLAGRGTPVIAGGRVYASGYEGEGPDLREVLVCLDADTGRLRWAHRFTDFLSDVIYDRYAISSPVIDSLSGDVFFLSTAGLFNCFSADGDLRWQVSMMERFGRLTFPNGRTGSAVIDDDLVIFHVISAAWGPLGPARDRFYALDKTTGDLVWWSTPGVGPRDSSFSNPVLAWEDGRRVLYSGTGCGNIVCIDARTGIPLWRYQVSIGGVNSAVVLHDDEVIAIHGRENLDSSEIGRMLAIARSGPTTRGAKGPAVLGVNRERWRNDLVAFSSSPVLVGDRVYQTVHTGELCAVNADTGAVLWQEKLAAGQIHASPVYADGKLYVPMNNGTFHVVRPTDAGPQRLAEVQLAGNCLGAPAVADGRVYVHTTEALYCFGQRREPVVRAIPGRPMTMPKTATHLQVVPAEVLARPGDDVPLTVRSLDARGQLVREGARGFEVAASPAVDVQADAASLRVADDARPGAAQLKVTSDTASGAMRVRVVPRLPVAEDFESFELAKTHAVEEGVRFAFPPSHWIGGRAKWEVREGDDGQVLAKTLDRSLFQRVMTLVGHPDDRDYTMQVDVKSDGTRRSMSTVGVVNQRYIIALKGNHQQLQVSSNDERLKVGVPFRWRPGTWYRLKARVDREGADTVVVRAKAWPRDEPEPATWTIEVPQRYGHTHGTPGLYAFAPQQRFRVYVDNIEITPNP